MDCGIQHILPIVQIISYLVAGVGIFIAALTYRYNRNLKKAEWLKSLFEKFYENITYKEVRKLLDYSKLQTALDNDVDNVNEEKLADFLNFFEFIAALKRAGQLDLGDVKSLFAYYLNLINNSELCIKFIQDYKYKNLEVLLRELK